MSDDEIQYIGERPLTADEAIQIVARLERRRRPVATCPECQCQWRTEVEGANGFPAGHTVCYVCDPETYEGEDLDDAECPVCNVEMGWCSRRGQLVPYAEIGERGGFWEQVRVHGKEQ